MTLFARPRVGADLVLLAWGNSRGADGLSKA